MSSRALGADASCEAKGEAKVSEAQNLRLISGQFCGHFNDKVAAN